MYATILIMQPKPSYATFFLLIIKSSTKLVITYANNNKRLNDNEDSKHDLNNSMLQPSSPKNHQAIPLFIVIPSSLPDNAPK